MRNGETLGVEINVLNSNNALCNDAEINMLIEIFESESDQLITSASQTSSQGKALFNYPMNNLGAYKVSVKSAAAQVNSINIIVSSICLSISIDSIVFLI